MSWELVRKNFCQDEISKFPQKNLFCEKKLKEKKVFPSHVKLKSKLVLQKHFEKWDFEKENFAPVSHKTTKFSWNFPLNLFGSVATSHTTEAQEGHVENLS